MINRDTTFKKPRVGWFCSLFIALCMSIPLAVSAQTGLQGTVSDEITNESLVGATIFILETEQGTNTNVDGEFELTGIDPGDYTIQVSFIGYNQLQQSISVSSGEMLQLDLQLSPEEIGLDELVVTGYGIRQRREVTGAISSVRADQITSRAIQTPDQALQGRSAGLQFVGSSGAPGSQAEILIRGTGSINSSNTPLYIVDGVPLEDYFRSNIATTNTALLSGLNPSDIESIDVLRDAEATAIYGAQGANGVVLITTRRGQQGATQFTANVRFGTQELNSTYDLMTGPQFVEFMQEAAVNRALDLGNDPEAARQSAINTYGHPDEVGTYDWFDAMTRTGTNSNYNLSAAGGSETTRFFVSGGYNNVEGAILSSSYERTTLRVNIDHDASDRLSFTSNVNLSRSTMTGQSETGGNFINSPFHGAVTTRPTTPIFNEDGTYNQDIPAITYNMLQVLREEERIGREFQLIGNLAATYNVNENLAFRGQFNTDIRLSRDRRYNNPSIPRYNNYGGSVFERTTENENFSGNIVADYITSFQAVHNISVVGGTEYRVRDYRFHSATGEMIPNPLLGQLNLAGVASAVAGRTTQYKTAGAFSRFQYNYDQRYFASFNLRYDGHSRFGSDTRWGLFYSMAFAWDAAREGFLQDVAWVNQLKPRVSYGITGNAGIDDFSSLALFGSGGTYMGSTGLRPSQLGNANLGWEQARSTDIAVDFALFEDRVYGSFGAYRTDNENLLLNRNLPNDSGFSSITENVGSVRNEGLEIELGAVVLSYGQFSWSSDFNITFPRSEVLSLEGDQEWMSDPNITSSRIYVGQQRHQWWVRNYAGVNPADGRALFYDADGELTYSVGGSDYFTAGSIEPDYYGGWSNQFSYGPVSMDIFFQYEFGSRILDEQYSNFHLAPHRGRNLSPDMFRRWQQPGDITDIPKPYTLSSFPGGTGHNLFSDRRLYDGSYIRLKSINVSYNLPAGLVQRMSLSSLSVFARAENLLTWTNYPGLDPEVFAHNQTRYPLPRSLEFGAEIRF
ncbi:TonB-dependent receptor [Rhodohalobacter sp. SW132]|uniref:SusC/RagA family TonB-linked outer membrane protein n=1 Tax=Rhodohalobacter sp. SW132 TaxID=2293433 RepID=UPI000E277263|nr:TonB-dependent receptor [Rhodohalobacter sp. SW132]REL38843.1 TonB-dependent receptor [Rhodohalobacter sp. SW132]